jgi:hypothetical protein
MLRTATVGEIAALPGFGERTAQTIYAALHPAETSAGPASHGGTGT